MSTINTQKISDKLEQFIQNIPKEKTGELSISIGKVSFLQFHQTSKFIQDNFSPIYFNDYPELYRLTISTKNVFAILNQYGNDFGLIRKVCQTNYLTSGEVEQFKNVISYNQDTESLPGIKLSSTSTKNPSSKMVNNLLNSLPDNKKLKKYKYELLYRFKPNDEDLSDLAQIDIVQSRPVKKGHSVAKSGIFSKKAGLDERFEISINLKLEPQQSLDEQSLDKLSTLIYRIYLIAKYSGLYPYSGPITTRKYPYPTRNNIINFHNLSQIISEKLEYHVTFSISDSRECALIVENDGNINILFPNGTQYSTGYLTRGWPYTNGDTTLIGEWYKKLDNSTYFIVSDITRLDGKDDVISYNFALPDEPPAGRDGRLTREQRNMLRYYIYSGLKGKFNLVQSGKDLLYRLEILFKPYVKYDSSNFSTTLAEYLNVVNLQSQLSFREIGATVDRLSFIPSNGPESKLPEDNVWKGRKIWTSPQHVYAYLVVKVPSQLQTIYGKYIGRTDVDTNTWFAQVELLGLDPQTDKLSKFVPSSFDTTGSSIGYVKVRGEKTLVSERTGRKIVNGLVCKCRFNKDYKYWSVLDIDYSRTSRVGKKVKSKPNYFSTLNGIWKNIHRPVTFRHLTGNEPLEDKFTPVQKWTLATETARKKLAFSRNDIYKYVNRQFAGRASGGFNKIITYRMFETNPYNVDFQQWLDLNIGNILALENTSDNTSVLTSQWQSFVITSKTTAKLNAFNVNMKLPIYGSNAVADYNKLDFNSLTSEPYDCAIIPGSLTLHSSLDEIKNVLDNFHTLLTDGGYLIVYRLDNAKLGEISSQSDDNIEIFSESLPNNVTWDKDNGQLTITHSDNHWNLELSATSRNVLKQGLSTQIKHKSITRYVEKFDELVISDTDLVRIMDQAGFKPVEDRRALTSTSGIKPEYRWYLNLMQVSIYTKV